MSMTFFFFNDTATTEIYTLSLHDALPISHESLPKALAAARKIASFNSEIKVYPEVTDLTPENVATLLGGRSEEHTSELQSQSNLVCRLLLEKKKKQNTQYEHLNTHSAERR